MADVLLALREAREQPSRCRRVAAQTTLIFTYVVCTLVVALFVLGMVVDYRILMPAAGLILLLVLVVLAVWLLVRKRRSRLQASTGQQISSIHTNPAQTVRLTELLENLRTLSVRFKHTRRYLLGDNASIRRIKNQLTEISACMRTIDEWLSHNRQYTEADVEHIRGRITYWQSEISYLERSAGIANGQANSAYQEESCHTAAPSAYVLQPPAYQESDKTGPPAYSELDPVVRNVSGQRDIEMLPSNSSTNINNGSSVNVMHQGDPPPYSNSDVMR